MNENRDKLNAEQQEAAIDLFHTIKAAVADARAKGECSISIKFNNSALSKTCEELAGSVILTNQKEFSELISFTITTLIGDALQFPITNAQLKHIETSSKKARESLEEFSKVLKIPIIRRQLLRSMPQAEATAVEMQSHWKKIEQYATYLRSLPKSERKDFFPNRKSILSPTAARTAYKALKLLKFRPKSTVSVIGKANRRKSPKSQPKMGAFEALRNLIVSLGIDIGDKNLDRLITVTGKRIEEKARSIQIR